MAADGSDIICLSFHETNEWAPSVTHSGKLAYTRWDYVDRHWGTAHHFWESFPDGRDPRNYHGNYPLPWSAMTPGLQPDHYGLGGQVNGRVLRPDAIPHRGSSPGPGSLPRRERRLSRPTRLVPLRSPGRVYRRRSRRRGT